MDLQERRTFSRPKWQPWQRPPLHPECHSPWHQRATSHKPTVNKAAPFFLDEEGGKGWKSLVYTGIQCFTTTAVKPQLVQWSYELEWMLVWHKEPLLYSICEPQQNSTQQTYPDSIAAANTSYMHKIQTDFF